MQVRRPERVSEAEFLSWPESKTKVELIDGDVICSPAASYGHQEALGRLLVALRLWAHGRSVTIGQSPCDVRFAPNRILQPDAFVTLAPTPFRTEGPLTRVPELCIEVLSRDVRYDRITKRLLYAAAGVNELWIVSLDGWVERWTGSGLTEQDVVTDTLRTPLLEGFELDVTSLVGDR